MTFQKNPDSRTVLQVFPEVKQMPLEGLYLGQRLAEISREIGRPLVITNYLTDRNGVIAVADTQGHFHIPAGTKNASDWRLFQELMAQADIVICGSDYIQRVSAPGSAAENILSQFEPGKEFETLGEWRLQAGCLKRSPDLAIVSRTLDYSIPAEALSSGRRIVSFTTAAAAGSDRARAFTQMGIPVIGSGQAGVDGNRMIDWLSQESGYRVIMMAGGPRILELLLVANRLDIFFNTEVQREIPLKDPSTFKTVLPGRKKIKRLKEFKITYQYIQENVSAEDGSHITQFFLRYDRKGLLVDRLSAAP